MLGFVKEFLRDNNGSFSLEAALGTSISFLAFLSMFEFCFMLYGNSVLQLAAKQAVNYAIYHGTTADQISGSGSGPGTTYDPSGVNIAEAAAAALAQSAIHSSLSNVAVCPAWWGDGASVGGFTSSQCSNGNPNTHLGSASYSGSATSAAPGTTITVQVVWPYRPYLAIPYLNLNLTYTATGAVAY